jgi:hypothetical protein
MPISSTTLDTVAKLQQLVREVQHWIIQDLADEIWIGTGTCQWIPTADQKQQHVNACAELHQISDDLVRGYHRWRELDLWLRPWDKARVLTLETHWDRKTRDKRRSKWKAC